MGAQPSSAALYAVMSFILQGIPNIQVYCDDLFMHNLDKASHLKTINAVLCRLRKNGLRISPKKCKFKMDKITLFGFEISANGIKPAHDKLENLRKMTFPTTVTEIRSFLGFTNFFRHFVPNYSLHSARLSSLTRKNSRWKGGELPPEGIASFNYLKSFLLNVPTLNNPLPDRPFYLFTDASRGTNNVSGMIGWAVVQKGNHDKEWLPIVMSLLNKLQCRIGKLFVNCFHASAC